MSSAQLCIIVAVTLVLNACTRSSDNTPPSATTSGSPAASPVAAEAPLSTAVAPPAAASAVNKITPPVLKTPVPSARVSKPAAPPAASQALDLDALKKQLKETKAIGIFSKISLKNQVDDLMKRFHQYYEGKSDISIAELHRSYDLLMMKVLSLVQDDDQKLASAIVSSRQAIWNLLADPKKFATLES